MLSLHRSKIQERPVVPQLFLNSSGLMYLTLEGMTDIFQGGLVHLHLLVVYKPSFIGMVHVGSTIIIPEQLNRINLKKIGVIRLQPRSLITYWEVIDIKVIIFQ